MPSIKNVRYINMDTIEFETDVLKQGQIGFLSELLRREQYDFEIISRIHNFIIQIFIESVTSLDEATLKEVFAKAGIKSEY